MNSVEQTIENIKLLIAGGDLSDTPQLRQLHKECVEIFKELRSNLEQCRAHVENGSIQMARQLNCSFDPSLTRVAEYLEYFKGSDFFPVCRDYGLEVPEFPDEQLLRLLNTPASTGEKRLHGLLQDYRKIARNGSMVQRIALLRKIVNKLPNSSRWRNDLVSAERSRWQEIEKEVELLGETQGDCRKLEELFREVSDPEWSIPPKAEVVDSIKKLLLPLQQAQLNKEVDSRLQSLLDCWMERDLDRLKEEFEKWRVFSSNPMIVLNSVQKQTLADVENFCRTADEEKRNQESAQELIRRIEQKLADDAPFTALAGDWNQLQLMECQVPQVLAERLKSREDEHQRYEHLRHIRFCVAGVCGAMLLVAFIVAAVFYTQHWLAVKRNCGNMESLMAAQRYVEVINLYQKLLTSSPRVAASPKIILLHTTAGNELKMLTEKQKYEEEKFSTLLKQIENLAKEDVLDSAVALDKALAKAEQSISKNTFPKELLDKFSALETRIARRRTALKQKKEEEFRKFSLELVGKVNRLAAEVRKKALAELDVSLSMVETEFKEKMKNYPYVPAHLKERAQKDFQTAVQKFKGAKKKEEAFRRVDRPADFESYLKSLEGIEYEYPEMAQSFFSAISRVREFRQLCESYKKFAPLTLDEVQDVRSIENVFLKKDLEKIFPKTSRSSGFARFYKGIMLQKDMKELCFTDAQGKDYFFYISGEVRLEKLRRPVRNNISFIANAVGKEKNRRFVFSYNSKEKLPFKLLSKHGDLPYKLPEQFASLSGQTSLTPELMRNFWPGHELGSTFSSLDSDGPGLSSNLQAALLFIAGEGNVKNAYLKELLLIHFLQELCELSPLFTEVADKLKGLQEFRRERQREWRAPQIVSEYNQEREQLRQLWGQLDLKRLFAAGKLRGDFICAAHARGLFPAGVVREKENGKTEILLFNGQSPLREGFVFDGKMLLPLPGSVLKQGGSEDAGWKKQLFRGQVIWGFSDGKTVREFMREWQKKARDLNVYLQIKPSIFSVGDIR